MLSLPVLADNSGIVEALDSTRVAVRSTQPFQRLNGPDREVVLAGDFSTSPAIRLVLASPSWDFSVAYTETITATDFELSLSPDFVQSGAVSAGWHNHFWRVAVSEAGSYSVSLNPSYVTYGGATAPTQKTTTGGGMQTGGMQPGQTTGGTMTPTMGGTGTQGTSLQPQLLKNDHRPIEYGTTATAVNISAKLARHATFSVFGGYQVGGGLDFRSKLALAEQYGPNAGVALGAELSRLDSFNVRVDASETFTTGTCIPPQPNVIFCHEVVPIVEAGAGVHHRLSATEGLDVSAGVAGTTVWSVNAEKTRNSKLLIIVPVETATYLRTFGHDGLDRFGLSEQLGPVVDALSGALDYRVQLTAVSTQYLLPRISVTATAGWAQSLFTKNDNGGSPEGGLTLFNAGLEAHYQLNHQIDLVAGEQNYWQNQYGASGASEIGYINVTLRTLPLHL